MSKISPSSPKWSDSLRVRNATKPRNLARRYSTRQLPLTMKYIAFASSWYSMTVSSGLVSVTSIEWERKRLKDILCSILSKEISAIIGLWLSALKYNYSLTISLREGLIILRKVLNCCCCIWVELVLSKKCLTLTWISVPIPIFFIVVTTRSISSFIFDSFIFILLMYMAIWPNTLACKIYPANIKNEADASSRVFIGEILPPFIRMPA